MSSGTRKPVSTIAKARTGAQTMGAFTVSTTLAARMARGDVRGDSERASSCGAELLPCDSFPVVLNSSRRIVPGTTVRLLTRLPTAIGMAALERPNRSPRTAGPTKCDTGQQKNHPVKSNRANAQRDDQREVLA